MTKITTESTLDTKGMLVGLCYKAAQVPSSASIYTGIRKIVRGLTYELKELPTPELSDLNYTKAKLSQLSRNYENPGEIATARTKLAARRSSPHTSVAVSTLGSAKDSRSQGFCLRQLVVTQTPKYTEIDVIWRSTELVQRNTADFLLIPELVKQLDLAHDPAVYRMYMANSYLTALTMPYLFKWCDGVEFFEHLKLHDPKYFRTALNAFAKFLEDQSRYSYKHRQKSYNFAHTMLSDEHFARLHAYCIDNGARFIHG